VKHITSIIIHVVAYKVSLIWSLMYHTAALIYQTAAVCFVYWQKSLASRKVYCVEGITNAGGERWVNSFE
jgi:hypothetical protein